MAAAVKAIRNALPHIFYFSRKKILFAGYFIRGVSTACTEKGNKS